MEIVSQRAPVPHLQGGGRRRRRGEQHAAVVRRDGVRVAEVNELTIRQLEVREVRSAAHTPRHVPARTSAVGLVFLGGGR
jgi:hypothetical protein